MSVKSNDYWISHVWPSVADDCLRLQKITPTRKSGNKYSAKLLLLGEVITERYTKKGGPATLLGLLLIPRKKRGAFASERTLCQVVNFTADLFVARHREVI